MNCILFDFNRTQLLPLTFTRPVAELRCGILTIREKWQRHLPVQQTSFFNRAVFASKIPVCVY